MTPTKKTPAPLPPFPWKIGELADHTGISTKTLRHYDEIGLLAPSATAANGYRMYGERDLERLQQILSLKNLGLPLEKIKATLAEPNFSAEDLLTRQFTQMREQLAAQQEMVERLDGMMRLLHARKAMTAHDMLDAIAMMQKVESYYSDEERAYIHDRAKKVGREAIVQGEQDWQTLMANVKAEMDKGTPPTSKKMIGYAKQWMQLIEQFTGGNPQIAAKLKTMYDEHPDASRQFGGPNPAMMTYIQQAMEASKRSKK